MNKREKEVALLQLQAEKKVLADIEKQYKKALRDIEEKIKLLQSDELTQSKVYQLQYQKALKGQVEAIVEKLHADEYSTIQQFLHDSYTHSFVGTMYSVHGQGVPAILPMDQAAAVQAIITDSKISEGLYSSLGVDTKKLKKAISAEITRGIGSNLPFADIARSIQLQTRAPLSRAKTIVRTESHRIQEAAASDARNGLKEQGCDVVKQWDSTLDGNTRPTHRKLDGKIVEADESFELENGKKAQYPGDFGKPEEDCNCRCLALTRARWELDEEELKQLKERAEFFGLDKKDDFKTFEEKYLKALDDYDHYKMVSASKIEANGLFVNKTEKLYKYAKKIPPLEGYEDFTCHADADSFYIDVGGMGLEEDFFRLTPEEYAIRIKQSSTYKGGNIRIISCQAGAKEDGAAQRIADALGVDVYAPTETVHVTESGEMFISDSDTLAEMWYNEEDRSVFKQTGTWKLFKPRKE